MDPTRWRRERDIFIAAADLEGAEREAVLSSHCGLDLDLRRAVEALLEVGREAGSFLETPAFVGQADLFVIPSPELLVGSTIGNHRLTRLLAEGGMGLVFEARQESPARTVAVKVLKASLHDPAAAHRFRVEAETLGRLSHPGVAQIFEAGLHPLSVEGQRVLLPYFAMEYVEGAAAITTFAAQAGLNLRQRLVLMVAACEAIHHGHVRGIIHCDLKPDNILVNSEGRLKIIDFGVASSVRLETASLAGLIALRAGTVPYMSPEQQRAEALVDARSDVYSLGAVAYELVCGRPPEPSGNSLEAGASPRSAVPAPEALSDSTGRRVDRDLEAILRKALSANPQDRYASASELAGDLQRLLAHRPVNARSAGWPHHLRLLARRHPLGAAAAAGVLLLVTGFGTAMGWLASSLEHERAEAETQSIRATALRDFLTDVVAQADPTRSQRSSLTVLEVLTHFFEETDRRFDDDPRTAAALHAAAGGVYQSLVVPDKASAHLDRAWEIHSRLGETGSDAALWVLQRQAQLDREMGQFKRAIERMQDVVAGHERLGDAWAATSAKRRLAETLLENGEIDQAHSLLESIEADIVAHGDPAELGGYWNTMGYALYDLRRRAEAMEAFEQSIRCWIQAQGEQSYQVAGVRMNLANLHRAAGSPDKALELIRSSISIFIAIEGEDSVQALLGRVSETAILQALGRLEEAAQVALQAYERLREVYGATNIHALRAKHNLSRAYAMLGRHDEALQAAIEVAEAHEDQVGPDHPSALRARLLVATILKDMHREAEAAALLADLLERAPQSLGEAHTVVVSANAYLVDCLIALGNDDEAIQRGEALLSTLARTSGPADPVIREMATLLQDVYVRLGRAEDAARMKALLESTAPREPEP